MLILALVLAGLAALIHVYIFVLESLRWEQPATRAVFGTSAETALTTKPLAYNQGFYNLFLAIVTGVGIAIVSPERHAAIALLVAGCGSMAAAALVLATSDRSKLRAAAIQGLVPCLALAALALH